MWSTREQRSQLEALNKTRGDLATFFVKEAHLEPIHLTFKVTVHENNNIGLSRRLDESHTTRLVKKKIVKEVHKANSLTEPEIALGSGALTTL